MRNTQLRETNPAAEILAGSARERSLYIEQVYERYTPQDQETWRVLYGRMQPLWREYANPYFLHGVETLALPADRIPRLDSVNHRLAPLTGFRARAVAGYVPAFLFFDCLRRREFPTTIAIRPADRLDYLPEPDIFHDIAGHVPMHADPMFAAALVRFGDCAQAIARRARTHPVEHTVSAIRALARVFWFTVEFGLIRGPRGQLQACGSGLLSSHGELPHAIESPRVVREPFRLEWVMNQPFEIDHYQPLFAVLDSFGALYEALDTLARWIEDGRLDAVAPGEPHVNGQDLQSYLRAVAAS